MCRNPLPRYCDAQYFTPTAMENFDNAKKSSLSRMKQAHKTALIIFQVKSKTWKSKPTITSIDISDIKRSGKLKCQEIKKSVLTTIGEVIFSRSRVAYKHRNRQQFFYCEVYSGLLSKSFI